MFKLVLVLALVAAVNCDGYETAIPSALEPPTEQSVNDFQPQYKFKYDVHDSVSGDSKNHVETRNGNVVQGEYSLIDADGFKRIVKYTADSVNGFNAVVDRQPIKTEASLPPVPKEDVLVEQQKVVKNVAPITYSASTITGSVPVNYVVKSIPNHLGYSSGQVIYRSIPLSYNVANFIGSPQVAYSGPVAFTQFHPSVVPVAALRAGW